MATLRVNTQGCNVVHHRDGRRALPAGKYLLCKNFTGRWVLSGPNFGGYGLTFKEWKEYGYVSWLLWGIPVPLGGIKPPPEPKPAKNKAGKK